MEKVISTWRQFWRWLTMRETCRECGLLEVEARSVACLLRLAERAEKDSTMIDPRHRRTLWALAILYVMSLVFVLETGVFLSGVECGVREGFMVPYKGKSITITTEDLRPPVIDI